MSDDKIAILSLRDINEAVKLRLYEKSPRSGQIPFNDRMELCKHAADLNIVEYLENKLKQYLPGDRSL